MLLSGWDLVLIDCQYGSKMLVVIENKVSLKGCKLSSLNALGTETPPYNQIHIIHNRPIENTYSSLIQVSFKSHSSHLQVLSKYQDSSEPIGIELKELQMIKLEEHAPKFPCLIYLDTKLHIDFCQNRRFLFAQYRCSLL